MNEGYLHVALRVMPILYFSHPEQSKNGCIIFLYYVAKYNETMIICLMFKKGYEKMTIGSKIKNLRKSRKMTQEDFAQQVGISRSTLSCYEIGQRTPNLKTLSDIAEIFGIGLDYFGVSAKDEAFDLLTRAKEVFENQDISTETKEELYHEFMKLYLAMKEQQK